MNQDKTGYETQLGQQQQVITGTADQLESQAKIIGDATKTIEQLQAIVHAQEQQLQLMQDETFKREGELNVLKIGFEKFNASQLSAEDLKKQFDAEVLAYQTQIQQL